MACMLIAALGGNSDVVCSLMYLLLRQARSCVCKDVVRCLQVPCCADDLNQDSIEGGIRLHSIPALHAQMSGSITAWSVHIKKAACPCIHEPHPFLDTGLLMQ